MERIGNCYFCKASWTSSLLDDIELERGIVADTVRICPDCKAAVRRGRKRPSGLQVARGLGMAWLRQLAQQYRVRFERRQGS